MVRRNNVVAALPAAAFLIASLIRNSDITSRHRVSSSRSRRYSNYEDEEEGSLEVEKYGREAEDEQLNQSLSSTIATTTPNVSWDDVAGLEGAKREIQMAAEMPILHPELFTGNREPCRFILLYGPPGTGKGQLIKALATSSDSTLFTVTSSDVQSKWYGESERLVRLVFENARRQKPSIIFFDEIDALCGSRDADSSSEHDNRVKNEFLVQMDGVTQDNTGVLFIAATNMPWNLDSAFRRRLQKRIHIPLPDSRARRRMFKTKIGTTPCRLSSKDYDEFSRMTEGFSGSDISNVVQDALAEPIRLAQLATHWQRIRVDGETKYTPSYPGEHGARAMTWREVPRGQLLVPKLIAEDLYTALDRARPSVGRDEVQRYYDWTQQYGMEGS